MVILLLEIEGNTYNDRRKYISFGSYKIEGFSFKIEGNTYLLFAFYSIRPKVWFKARILRRKLYFEAIW